jgi:lysophospholipase L1-like esterase
VKRATSAAAKGILRRMSANFGGRTGLTKRLGALTVLVAGLVAGSVAAPAAAHQKTADLVVLGDSYSAGIGADQFESSHVIPDPRCVVTSSGYADALVERRRAVELTANAACSGAQALDVASEPAEYDVPDLPQQIRFASATNLLDAETDLVAVTVGGNDVQFGNIIGACAQLPLPDCEAAVAQAVAVAENRLAPALAQNYRQIHDEAPDATIAAVGYPHLFDTKRGSTTPLSPEAAKVFNEGVDVLNSIIERAADASPSTVYVDVTKRFKGHGIGSEDPWINFDPASPADMNNFHPTAEGYAKGYAKSLNQLVGSAQR